MPLILWVLGTVKLSGCVSFTQVSPKRRSPILVRGYHIGPKRISNKFHTFYPCTLQLLKAFIAKSPRLYRSETSVNATIGKRIAMYHRVSTLGPTKFYTYIFSLLSGPNIYPLASHSFLLLTFIKPCIVTGKIPRYHEVP